jgi:phosphonate utilization transcriptional regulator
MTVSLSALKLLQSSSLPSLVQAEIEQMILRGDLKPGARLNESELALRFGTSRGPVREALRGLEECRLVRAEKNRGVHVREISLAEADEIYDLRELLDEWIGKRVAKRATPDAVAALRQTLAEMEEASAAGDVRRYHSANLAFHERLVDLAGNSRLSEIYRLLTKELMLFRLRGLAQGGGLAVSVSEHRAIVDAIGRGEALETGRLLRRHAADSRLRMHKAEGA